MFNTVKNMFVKENSVKGASIILIVTLALSNILGVFRDHFLAQKIPTDMLDTYFAAFRLPDLIFNVLILSAIAAAFVPVYSNYLKEKGFKSALRLSQASMTVGVVAVSVCLIILFFLMPYLMYLLVPSFDVAKRQETVVLARWLLISPFFFTISYFLGGILNSHKRFLTYSIAPLIYNLSIIAGVLLLSEKYSVMGAVIGVVIGAFLHMLIQLVTAIRLGFYPRFIFDVKEAGVRKIFRLMLPRAIGLGANQILLVAYTVFASAFSGGIAIYTFADNIQTVPSVIFGTSFATAVFPTLAGLSLSKKEDAARFETFFEKSARAILFFLIPSTAIFFILRAQIIRLILGYGFFGWSDTKVATATLGFFTLSIIAQGLIPLLARSFYAMHNTKTPMITTIASIILSIILGYFFSRADATQGVAGLALAFSVGSWLNLAALWILLDKKIAIDYRNLIYFIFKILILTFATAVLMQLAKVVLGNIFDIDRVRFLALQTVAVLGVGAFVYLGGAWLLRIKEIRT